MFTNILMPPKEVPLINSPHIAEASPSGYVATLSIGMLVGTTTR
jgi:hypothetical protein